MTGKKEYEVREMPRAERGTTSEDINAKVIPVIAGAFGTVSH